MNRWMNKVVTFASLTASLTLVPAGVAFAEDAQQQGQAPGPRHLRAHRDGVFAEALELDSLTPAQRTQIEQLMGQRRAANAPVRQADAAVLTILAQQVEAAKVDDAALAPSLTVKKRAEAAGRQADRAAIVQLHGILTPAQRGAVVDALEARMAARADKPTGKERLGMGKLGLSDQQKAEVRANLQASRGGPRHAEPGVERKAALDAFRGDTFDGSGMVGMRGDEDRQERVTKALIPVLTPNQRAALAGRLRNRAARETRST